MQGNEAKHVGETGGWTQPHVFPVDLLEAPAAGEGPPLWTCVRTRPRWEKKFAQWLSGRRVPHYLPCLPHESISHRKHRLTHLPLFPGYVFVQGRPDSHEFQGSACVAYLLRPRNDAEHRVLDAQLRALYAGLSLGTLLAMTDVLDEGDEVEIIAGPMRGHRGRFTRRRGRGRLVLSVDMVGSGVELELPESSVVRAAGGRTTTRPEPVAAGT